MRDWMSVRASGSTRNGGRSSQFSILSMPARNSRTSVVRSPATASPTRANTPSTSTMLPSREQATASGRGMMRAAEPATGRSTAVTTRPRNTATAISWNRPSSAKTA